MNKISWENFSQEIADYVGVDVSDIKEETDIYEDLCIDSLGLFGLGSHITETFKMNVPLSSVASICKVGDMFKLLNEKGVSVEE